MYRRFCHLALLILLLGDSVAADTQSASLVVKYPLIADDHEREFDPYFIAMLALALEKSGRPYSLQGVESPLVLGDRIHRMLDENRFSVYWLNSKVQLEAALTPIRVPLFKGLIGWRVLLIPAGTQEKFDHIQSREALARLKGIQGHDWPDTQILRANQLQIETSASWDGMFRMLSVGRVDYFPRSVIEVQRELSIFKNLNIDLEKRLVLRYPSAYYFFVNKQNRELAFALNEGLLKAHADGSFDELFNRHFSQLIDNLQLTRRNIIEMQSFQYFPENPEFWYSVSDIEASAGVVEQQKTKN